MAPPAEPAHLPIAPAPPHPGVSPRAYHSPPIAPMPRKRGFIDLANSSDDDERNGPGARRPRKVPRGASGDAMMREREDREREELYLVDSDGDIDYMAVDLSDVDPAEFRARNLLAAAGPAPRAADALVRDPLEAALETVAGILPDVDLGVVRALLDHQPALGPANVEAVLEELLAREGGYPTRVSVEALAEGAEDAKRRDVKGKGKAREEKPGRRREEEEDTDDEEVLRVAKQWVDATARKAPSRAYQEGAVAQLYRDFPSMRQADIKQLFTTSGSSLYAPAYLALEKWFKQPANARPFRLMTTTRVDKGKGKAKVDDELEREILWVREHSVRYLAALTRSEQLEARLEAEVASGAYFECGCCFADCALSQMVVCAAGCAFCKDCARMNADTQIGMRKFVLPCMSTSGCSSTFLESEYPTFLPRKSIVALHKIKQEKEVDEAALEGLEKCPFCPFAMIIENPHERLFRCHREDCRIVSCRECKKKDHLPATCAEASEDAKLSKFHAVEEAMSAALIRRCPKPGCGEPYVKESSTCNKIRCASCATLSCYICNKIITGYTHFVGSGSNLPPGAVVEAGATCALWDDTDQRNFQEVEAARIAAEATARAANPALSDADLAKLAMEKPPPPPAKIAHLPPPRIDNGYQRIHDIYERARARVPVRPPPPHAAVVAAAAAPAAPAKAPAPLPPRRRQPSPRKAVAFADEVAGAQPGPAAGPGPAAAAYFARRDARFAPYPAGHPAGAGAGAGAAAEARARRFGFGEARIEDAGGWRAREDAARAARKVKEDEREQRRRRTTGKG